MSAVNQLTRVSAPKFMARLFEWLATPPPVQSDDDSDWYAGLCVDPSDFTDQLCRLQDALHPGNVSAGSKPRAAA